MNTTTQLLYGRSVLNGFPLLMLLLRDLLASNPCEAMTQKRRAKIIVERLDNHLALSESPPRDTKFEVDALRTLRDVCAAYTSNDPDGSIARILGVCALLDIEVHS